MKNHQLIVQLKINAISQNNLNLRYSLEDALDAQLKESDNGYCDGGDIGNNNINIFLFVNDKKIAIDLIRKVLTKLEMNGKFLIAERLGNNVSVIYPPDHSSQFNY